VRLLQLLILALLVTVVKGDTFATGSSTLSQFHPTGLEVLYNSDTSCSTPTLNGNVFAECDYTTDYGHLFLSLTDSGSGDPSEGGGCDGCSPLLGAQNEATVGFRDRIIFYGPPGKTVSVGWSIDFPVPDANFNLGTYGDIGFGDVDLPFDGVTFDVPYDVAIGLSGWLGIYGDGELFESADLKINGFHVFDSINPACASYDAAGSICGPPLDVSIYTRSGFLYGGHTPEPSSLLLLATASLALLLVTRPGRIEHNFGLRRMRRDR